MKHTVLSLLSFIEQFESILITLLAHLLDKSFQMSDPRWKTRFLKLKKSGCIKSKPRFMSGRNECSPRKKQFAEVALKAKNGSSCEKLELHIVIRQDIGK